MTKRPNDVQDPTGQQRVSGQPTPRQATVLLMVAIFIASVGTTLLRLDVVPTAIVVCLVGLALTFVGNAIIRRFNRRHR